MPGRQRIGLALVAGAVVAAIAGAFLLGGASTDRRDHAAREISRDAAPAPPAPPPRPEARETARVDLTTPEADDAPAPSSVPEPVARPSGFAIRGSVVEEGTGRPVADAVVGVFVPSPGLPRVALGRPKGVATDEGGRFFLTGLEPGTVRLRTWHERLVECLSDPIEGAEGGTVEDVVLRLGRGGGVDGYALDLEGAPLAGGWVSVFPPRIQSIGARRAEIDRSNGYFLAEGLDPGRHRVQAFPPRGHLEPIEDRRKRIRSALADVREGEITRVEFPETAIGGCIVRGRVLRGGGGVSHVLVTVLPKGVLEGDPDRIALAGDRLHDTTDEDGAFEIESVPAGPASLFAHPRGNGSPAALDVVVPEEPVLEVEIRFPPGEIRGRVTRASDDTPVRGIPVAVFPREPIREVRGSPSDVETDPEGRYRVLDLFPGRYLVRVGPTVSSRRSLGFDVATEIREPVYVTDDAPTVEDFALVEEGRALVVVRDPEGNAVRDLWVDVHPDGDPSLFRRHSGVTRADGTARIGGLAPGRYAARARGAPFAEARAPVTGRVDAGEETLLPIRLEAGTRVRVRVRGASGSILRNPFVEWVDGDGRETRIVQGSTGIATPEELEGGFGVVVLLPGEYTMRVRANDHRPREVAIRVWEVSPQEIEVSLEASAGPPR